MQLVRLYLKSKMPKLIKQTTGYLSRIIKGDKKYAIHLNVPGVILIGESEKKYPGKSDAEKKALVLTKLCKEYDRVVFVDDDKKNVSAARNLNIPNLKVIKAWDE